MAEPRRHHRYSYAEYAAFETFSDAKHEFLDGEIYAMAGGSEDHSALAAEMIGLLRDAIRGRPCKAHTSDLRIHVQAANLSTYPDASVFCEPLQRYEPGPETTALNPAILVEVTSDSSEEYDLGEKRKYYRMIPSLREYVVVSHRERRITVDVRDRESWLTVVATRGERVTLPSLNVELVVDDIYRISTIG